MNKNKFEVIAKDIRRLVAKRPYGQTAFIGERRDKAPIGGTFTLSAGFVTSAPLRFNASQKMIDRTMVELAEEDDAVRRIRAKRKRRKS